ncbi:methyl-accepting chemotaxis protein (MCP) signaling protein [Motilibacter peucedani]|uniref:Methyl-accepting chemotaxis protein (MCP) signaling protein n=1 Tax=Motilibacter peucedani TaxID=598650 RepID=A0A420XNR7_9ACTN|nr:Cache 3/Cache 2 fusion domain-containing protein [Motilibacter peucedani]RKS73841.1 methyl-accepting chemotaxis protein (MCP) signaling protein [Motilibacter peucedani]
MSSLSTTGVPTLLRDDPQSDRAREQVIAETVALSAASGQVSASFAAIVSEVREMHESIEAISRTAQQGLAVASTAVENAEATSDRVTRLQRAAAEIGEVVSVISSITQQSHMLALNATIEAARVGDAGRGFAVVADEVKGLARRTAEAAGRIAQQVGAVQEETAHAARAIDEIRGNVAQMSEMQSATAAAMEEQSTQVATIASTFSEASSAASAINGSVERLVSAQQLAYVSSAIRSALTMVLEAGGVSFADGSEAWTVTDQFSGATSRAELPTLLVGGTPLGANADPRVRTPVVDAIVERVGGTCTLFQRNDADDSFVRIATTIVNERGRRNIGTALPRCGADGGANVVVTQLLRGETYYGEAVVVGRTFVTAYTPLHQDGRVVGALYVGVPKEG